MNANTETLVAANPRPLDMFFYQPVFSFHNERKYLKSVNLLKGKQILKKIYLDNLYEYSEETNIEEFITEILIKNLTEAKDKKEKQNGKTKQNAHQPDRNARAKAAATLFDTLGI